MITNWEEFELEFSKREQKEKIRKLNNKETRRIYGCYKNR